MRIGSSFAVVAFVDRGATLLEAQRWLLGAGLEARCDPLSPSIGIHPPGMGEMIRVDLESGDKARDRIRGLFAELRPELHQPEFDAFYFVTVRDLKRIELEGVTLARVLAILRECAEGELLECW